MGEIDERSKIRLREALTSAKECERLLERCAKDEVPSPDDIASLRSAAIQAAQCAQEVNVIVGRLYEQRLKR